MPTQAELNRLYTLALHVQEVSDEVHWEAVDEAVQDLYGTNVTHYCVLFEAYEDEIVGGDWYLGAVYDETTGRIDDVNDPTLEDATTVVNDLLGGLFEFGDRGEIRTRHLKVTS